MTIPIKIIKKSELKEKPEQEEIWDSIAIPWGKYVVKRIPFVEEFLQGKKGKVIDLGCGSGRNMIPNPRIEYWAVDFSSGQLMHARNYAEAEGINAHFFKLSADRLSKKDFKNEMFDYGLFIATLHCLESREKRLNALKEFHRVLKKGAEGLISVWNSEDKRFDPVGNRGDIYMSWKEDNVPYMRYYYLYEKKEFLGLLHSVGFEILEFYKPREHDRFSKKNWVVRVRKN
jgi:ubiquinone/menaquinone biosynthesis C-methylase UbiE